MKSMRRLWLLLGLALLTLSGCAVRAGPAVYMAAPQPVCPPGYYYAHNYGCMPLPVGVVLPPDATYATTRIDYLSLRSCPTTKCNILASLRLGEQVQVLNSEGSWTHVWAFTRGLEGWISSKYLN
ncbi:MAG: SH3 domain-containing protein [Solidesulfovibrio sp.]